MYLMIKFLKLAQVSLGAHKIAALSWIFRQIKILWDTLLIASIRLIVKKYGITSGVLVATDLSWHTIDIIQAYSLKWLVEFFFEVLKFRVLSQEIGIFHLTTKLSISQQSTMAIELSLCS